MGSSHDMVLERAAVINAAQAQVRATFADRDASPEATEAWSRACASFHEACGALYTDSFWVDVRRLADGDSGPVEGGLVFLEADPWCFRSGYAKENLLRALARHQLTCSQVMRVEAIVLGAVDVGERREFKFSCKLARAHLTARLRAELSQRLLGPDDGVAGRALLMLMGLTEPGLSTAEAARAEQLVDRAGQLARQAWRECCGDALYVPRSSYALARLARAE